VAGVFLVIWGRVRELKFSRQIKDIKELIERKRATAQRPAIQGELEKEKNKTSHMTH
jgi:hypothetical protein